jgi:uncharacterized protein
MDYAAYALCGLVSGFLAGLLGIGGGFVVVPAMVLLLPAAVGPTPLLPQMAVATSLMAMIPTTLAALRAQHRRGAVDAAWLARLAPGVCVGALIGAMLMPRIDARLVALLFVLYAGYFAVRLLLAASGRVLPAPWNAWPYPLVAALIGAVSVLAGVGGAIFTVPYLESRHLRMTHAVGTSSGVALSLSLVAAAGLALGSIGAQQSAMALVSWPAALCIGAAAVFTVPLGVRMAHRLPVAALKRAFACLLVLAASGSLWKVVMAHP